jgi:hypothetical protein
MDPKRRDSIRAGTARSVNPSTVRPPTQALSIPTAIQNAIEEQRGELGTAMTLLYCLHSVLRRATDDAGEEESDAVENAAGWVDMTELTALLMVRLNSVLLALDSVSLKQALKEFES